MPKIDKNFIWNAIGTTLNSFLSLFFLIIVTRSNGIIISGLFSYFYTLSLILQTISNYGTRMYQVSDVKKEFAFCEYFTARSVTSLISVIIAIIFCIVNQYNITNFSVLILLVGVRILETFSDVFYASFQKNNKLADVGKSLFLKAITSFVLFFMVNIITDNIVFSSVGMFIGTLIIFIFYDLGKIKKMEKIYLKFNLDVLRKGKYIFLFTFITLFIINIPRFIGNYKLSGDEFGYLGIMMMIPTVMALFSQFIIQPQVIILTNYYKKNEQKIFNNILKKCINTLMILCLICCLLAATIGPFALKILYNISFEKYRFGFCILILAGTLNGICGFFSTALTIFRNTKHQFYIYIIVALLEIILSYVMTVLFGFNGLLISYLLTMGLCLLLFYLIYKRQMKNILK